MKKLVAFVLAAVLALTAFAGCSTSGDSGTSTEGKKEFVLGLDDSFPPMGFRDENDKIVGFDIDLATEVCNRLGMELKVQPISWEAKEMELNNGTIDCIWNGLSVDPEREEAFLLSKPYMENRMIVITMKDSTIDSRADLKGLKVGVQKGSTALKAAQNDEYVSQAGELVEYDTNVLALTDLPTGRIDAIVMDEVVANYQLLNQGDNFKILDDALSEEQYAIAFKKGNTELCDKVNATLAEMISDGKAAEISEKWFGKDVMLKD